MKDSRADRSPGEFYQLDLEMSFVEQDDVFAAVEPVIAGVFDEFTDKDIKAPFTRISFAESMLKYGTDKPDLRIPLEIQDVTDHFRHSGFSIFAKAVSGGSVVRAIPGPDCGSRAFADKMNSWAQGEGAPGMGYIIYAEGEARGPVAKALGDDAAFALRDQMGLKMEMLCSLPVPPKTMLLHLLVKHGFALVRKKTLLLMAIISAGLSISRCLKKTN